MAIKSELNINSKKTYFSYIWSTKDRDSLEQYFKLKEKYDHELTKEDLELIIEKSKSEFGFYDLVIVPETKGRYLNLIAEHLGKKVFIVKKRKKEDIMIDLFNQKMMKSEKESLKHSLDEMDIIQINKIKGNQRKRFKNILFEKYDFSEYKDLNVLILDDSVFSGETLVSLISNINIECDVKVLFSKY